MNQELHNIVNGCFIVFYCERIINYIFYNSEFLLIIWKLSPFFIFPFFPCLIFCLVLLFLRDKFIATITHLVMKKVYNSKFSVSTMNPVFFPPLNDGGSAVKTRQLQQEEAELVFGTLNYKCSFNNSNVESLCKNISLVCCKYPTCTAS